MITLFLLGGAVVAVDGYTPNPCPNPVGYCGYIGLYTMDSWKAGAGCYRTRGVLVNNCYYPIEGYGPSNPKCLYDSLAEPIAETGTDTGFGCDYSQAIVNLTTCVDQTTKCTYKL